MTHVVVDIEIANSAENTFAFISNFENNPRWQDGMQRCTVTSDGDFGVGTTYDQVAAFLGREILSTFEVIEYEPGRRVKATTIAGSFPITFTRTVTPTDTGCHVNAIIEGDATGFFKLFAPLLDRMVSHTIHKDYAKLKQLLES